MGVSPMATVRRRIGWYSGQSSSSGATRSAPLKIAPRLLDSIGAQWHGRLAHGDGTPSHWLVLRPIQPERSDPECTAKDRSAIAGFDRSTVAWASRPWRRYAVALAGTPANPARAQRPGVHR